MIIDGIIISFYFISTQRICRNYFIILFQHIVASFIFYKMKKRSEAFSLLILLLFFFNTALGQVEEDHVNQNMEFLKEFREDWVPTLLSSNPLPIYSISQWNGFVFNWVPRGQKSNRSTYIDGIQWQSKLAGWDPFYSYASLYKSLQTQDRVYDNAFSKQGFGDNGTVHFVTTQSFGLKKSFIIGTRFSNSAFINEGFLQYKSGPMQHKWSYHFNLIFQQAPIGILPIGFKNIKGILLSIDKQLRFQQSIGLTFWWDQAAQGKISPSVQEAFTLSSQRNYNPSWGWYKGNAFYPNAKQSNVPIAYFRYEKKWADKAMLQIQFGIAMGNQKRSQMDWTKTIDPRPDYYKFLPSYSKDSILKQQLTQWFQENPQALQVNFDHLASINQSNALHRSFYIINTQVAQVSLLKMAIKYQYQFPNEWWGQIGFHLSKDMMRYYNVLDNLLGGAFFYNYNGWVDDNGSVDNFQNEIRKPDQKIVEGEKWGSDYQLENSELQAWGQLKKQTAHIEFSISMRGEDNYFRRVGFTQNGLFPSNSLGASPNLAFPSYGVKSQFLYKFSGRFYANSIFYYQTNAPSTSAIYLDPGLHAFTSSFILPELQKGFDFSLFYRTVSSKINVTAFWQLNHNESEKTLFYHDHFYAFVYGMLGQMQTIRKGIELGITSDLWGQWQLSAISSFGHFYIANNPLYEIKLANDLYQVESGVLQLKDLPVSNRPQFVHALSLQWQPSYAINLGMTAVFSMKRSIVYNYFRRSFVLKNKIDNLLIWNTIQSETYLPDQWVLNVFINKQYQLRFKNHTQQIKLNANIKNVFNTLIPIVAFEQSRFDYQGLSVQKFPLKYLYDQGTAFALGIQFQIY